MKIGIAGASSQVGSSLALYFKLYTEIEPVCFIRSKYSAVFFEMFDIEYKISGNKIEPDDLAVYSELAGIIDCTYPSVQLYDMEKTIYNQFEKLMPFLKPGSAFIYLSTIMAFGMPDNFKTVKNFKIPRSTYAYFKRKAERKVQQLSGKYELRGFNFRLGQVHGFLQSVNSSYREKLEGNKNIVLDGSENDPVNIIFISSLAEAIIKALNKEIKPSTYSLVNEPQWTLKELYEYYKDYYNLKNPIRFEPNKEKVVKKDSISPLTFLKRNRSLIENMVLTKSKKWYLKVKGKYRKLNVKEFNTIAEDNPYTDFHLLGRNPGKLIEGLHCSPENVLVAEKRMEEDYNKTIEELSRSV